MVKGVFENDTIVALATPPGRGGVGIVRLSGPAVPELMRAFLDKNIKPRHAYYGEFLAPDREPIDFGIALYFEAPHSFTGEHVLELQGHGGPVVMDRLIQAALSYGARLAAPGEFSRRAFENNRLDLAQAEAIADLINASSEEAARCAVRSLKGDFSKSIHNFLQGVIGLRTFLEASNDFPDEELEILENGEVAYRLASLEESLENLIAGTQRGVVLQEGIHIAVLGKPNAGKSSLFNALAGDERAIVTDVPGTTRDLIKEKILLDGHIVHLIDTAGIRKTNESIEEEGIRRAHQTAGDADHVLLVVDASAAPTPQARKVLAEKLLPENISLEQVTVVVNKIDLLSVEPQIVTFSDNPYAEVLISAKSGEGMSLLREHLAKVLLGQNKTQGQYIARRRHIDAMQRASEALQSGISQLSSAGAIELLAEDLRAVQRALDEVTGEFSQEDLLGEIFSSFCIGK